MPGVKSALLLLCNYLRHLTLETTGGFQIAPGQKPFMNSQLWDLYLILTMLKALGWNQILRCQKKNQVMTFSGYLKHMADAQKVSLESQNKSFISQIKEFLVTCDFLLKN